jgi:serine/threonine protein kinase
MDGVEVYKKQRKDGSLVWRKMVVSIDDVVRHDFELEFDVLEDLQGLECVPGLASELKYTEGFPYFDMALVKGISLSGIFRVRKKLAEMQKKGKLTDIREEVAPLGNGILNLGETRFLSRIAYCFEEIHEKEVVHRDIKPGNLFVCYGGNILVLDFGFASPLLDKPRTRIVGTPNYVSPEQIRNFNDVDIRGDVYSLAVVAYVGFTGETPYKETKERGYSAVLDGHLKGDADPVCELNPAVPRELSDIIAKGMALKPEDRYQTMEEFGRALESITMGGV